MADLRLWRGKYKMSIEHIVPSELEKCSKDEEDIHVKGIQEPKLKEYPMAKMGII